MTDHPDLRDAIARALARASTAGRDPTVYDLFRSLLHVSDVDRMIRETGGDPQLLAAELQAAAEKEQPGGFARLLALPSASGDRAFRQALAAARIQRLSASQTELRPVDVFLAGFTSGDAQLASILHRGGVSRLRLLRWLCGDQAQDLPALPEGDVLEVVLLNDDYTPMATVVTLLRTVFGLDPSMAVRTMMTVHREGSACLGRYPRDEAAALVRAALEMAAAEGAPLRAVLRSPEDGPPAEAATASLEALLDATKSFLAALARRLTWRSAAFENVASGDRMIVACALVSLVVWVLFGRYAAGPAPLWNPHGLTGVAWYATGLWAFVWALHRASAAVSSFRDLLAEIVGAVPLLLAAALAVQTWAPAVAKMPAFSVLVLGATLRVNRALVNAGARRLVTAQVAAAAFIVLFTWGSGRIFVTPKLWYPNRQDKGDREWAETERLLFEQADRIDAAADLRAGEPGRPDVFFLGFAGVGEEKVFAEEIQLSERVVSERYGAAGRTLLLLNDTRDRETRPLGTVHGLRRALVRIGARMDRSEDVLFLVLTSHGDAEPSLSVSNGTWPLDQLDGKALRSALEASLIKWRVIVISACHSGAFIPPLADENTIILTSAAANRVSFGCGNDRDLTEFGEAFLRDALPGAASLAAAFESAKKALAEREQRAGLTASLPQAHFGKAISAQWERVEAARASDPAVAANGRLPR